MIDRKGGAPQIPQPVTLQKTESHNLAQAKTKMQLLPMEINQLNLIARPSHLQLPHQRLQVLPQELLLKVQVPPHRILPAAPPLCPRMRSLLIKFLQPNQLVIANHKHLILLINVMTTQLNST